LTEPAPDFLRLATLALDDAGSCVEDGAFDDHLSANSARHLDALLRWLTARSSAEAELRWLEAAVRARGATRPRGRARRRDNRRRAGGQPAPGQLLSPSPR
jgi:hypothetical protein